MSYISLTFGGILRYKWLYLNFSLSLRSIFVHLAQSTNSTIVFLPDLARSLNKLWLVVPKPQHEQWRRDRKCTARAIHRGFKESWWTSRTKILYKGGQEAWGRSLWKITVLRRGSGNQETSISGGHFKIKEWRENIQANFSSFQEKNDWGIRWNILL